MVKNIIVFGAGDVWSGYWKRALKEAVGFKIIGFVERDNARAERAIAGRRGVWTVSSVDHIPKNAPRDAIIFVLTIEHLEIVRALSEQGFKNFVVEKPLVHSRLELEILMALIREKGLRLHAHDHYILKLFGIRALLGLVDSTDPRLVYLASPGSICGMGDAYLGTVSDISVTGVEAVPLEMEPPWFLNQEKAEVPRGGVSNDLLPHVVAPLVACGLMVERKGASLAAVHVQTLDETGKGLMPRSSVGQVDLLIDMRLQGYTPHHLTNAIKVRCGVVPEGEKSEWSLLVMGQNGNIIGNLQDGRVKVTLLPHSGGEIDLTPIVDPMRFAAQEIYFFFNKELPNFDGHLQAASCAIRIAEDARNSSPRL